MINHSLGKYVRGNIHTNTIAGYFSIFKRSIYGTYYHVSAKHLKRYLAEFDVRYNERAALGVDDTGRTEKAISWRCRSAANLSTASRSTTGAGVNGGGYAATYT